MVASQFFQPGADRCDTHALQVQRRIDRGQDFAFQPSEGVRIGRCDRHDPQMPAHPCRQRGLVDRGPLRSTDLVGLDIRLAVAEYLHDKLGERFAPPSLLRTMVARGDLGKKTGQGFYTW